MPMEFGSRQACGSVVTKYDRLLILMKLGLPLSGFMEETWSFEILGSAKGHT